MAQTDKIVVIPTYNERENIGLLIEKIFALGIPDLSIVIVDDNSPDGTEAVAQKLVRHYPIRIIHREKKLGLGRAYVHAFGDILANEKPDIVIQMDADLSHDPAAIPALIHALNEYDVALGSRYIPGGHIENWDTLRMLVSKLSNIYARAILGLPYHDVTGGYKAFRREALEKINIEKLDSIGYNFQIEMTYRMYRAGLRITETPITFTERSGGKSKFNISIIMESFMKVIALRLHG